MIDPSARFKVENAGIAISLLDYLFAIKNASLPTMTPLTVSTKTVGSLIHKGKKTNTVTRKIIGK